MTPLASLLAAVEAGDFDATPERPTPKFNAFCRAWEAAFDYAHNYNKGWDVFYRKDVTAAIALCEAMLPGCAVAVGFDENGPMAEIAHPLGCEMPNISERADTPARALLIAGLRALVAKESANG